MIKEIELKPYDEYLKKFGEYYKEENDNDEVEKKQFEIEDLSGVDWALRKIQKNTEALKEIKDYTDNEKMKYDLLYKRQQEMTENNNKYLQYLIKNYLDKKREEDPKYKITTAIGTVSTRKSTSWKYDDEKLLDFFKKNDMTKYIRVKEEINTVDFRKEVIVTNSGDVVVAETGEVVDGVEVTQEEKLFIRFK